MAAPITERAGCESGVPAESLAAYEAARRDERFGVAEIVVPERDLVDGVEVDTDLGRWRVYETPGHAPSHVVLHQPERGLLLSGDHLLGRVSLYYDFGYSPDPAGEFLASLDRVDALDVQLILAGRLRHRPEMLDNELPGMMMIGWG
jgi:glyoxylase-like metal-dependent hydrolase (beta-lactamase superfamily II)